MIIMPLVEKFLPIYSLHLPANLSYACGQLLPKIYKQELEILTTRFPLQY